MTITFASILFSILFIFRGVQKNTFFLLYVVSMILVAYGCENFWDWHVRLFSKTAFLLFILFHIPLINLFTFLAYGRDKSCAKRGAWRIPEIQLHTLEILGGTLGALAGQKIFRHKHKKKSYMVTFIMTIFAQIGLFLYILKYFHFI